MDYEADLTYSFVVLVVLVDGGGGGRTGYGRRDF